MNEQNRMIYGLGCDIINESRFEESDARKLELLAKKILSEEEYAEYLSVKASARFLAVRFSVKESISKSIKTGFRGFSLSDITLKHDSLGCPYVVCSEKLRAIMDEKGIGDFEVSISHDGGFVFTTALAMKK